MRILCVITISLSTSVFSTGGAIAQSIGLDVGGISVNIEGPLNQNNSNNENTDETSGSPTTGSGATPENSGNPVPDVGSVSNDPNAYLHTIERLGAEGFTIESVERSWLNRIIVKAKKGELRREIVLSQSTGLVLRDVIF